MVFKSIRDSLSAAAATWTFGMLSLTSFKIIPRISREVSGWPLGSELIRRRWAFARHPSWLSAPGRRCLRLWLPAVDSVTSLVLVAISRAVSGDPAAPSWPLIWRRYIADPGEGSRRAGA
jgi:hypothetical protein